MFQACNHEFFFSTHVSADDKCAAAQQGCQDLYKFANLYSVTFCTFNQNWLLTLFASLLLIFFLFRFLSAVVEDYLAPSIEYIAKFLHLSQSLAAVTLLAFANGSGDVVTAFVASDAPEGIDYNIGALYGAGLFVATIVVGVTIINSKSGVQLDARSVWRDLGFYIFATTVILIYGAIGELTMTDGVLLLTLYALLIITVIIQDRFCKIPPTSVNGLDSTSTAISQAAVSDVIDGHFESYIDFELFAYEQEQEKLSKASEPCACTCLGFVDRPIKGALKFFIPPAKFENYSKIWCTVSIIPGLMLANIIINKDLSQPYYLTYLLPLGCVVAFVIFVTYPESRMLPIYYPVIQIYITAISLILLYLITGLLIDTLSFIGMLSKLNPTYLGMTVIAIGNALPDGVVTIALARQGLAIMGITGAYVGQLFGLLVGLGIALIRRNAMEDADNQFDLFGNHGGKSQNLIMLIVICTTLGVLIITFVYSLFKKYLFRRDLSILLILTYLVMFSAVTAIAIAQAVNQ